MRSSLQLLSNRVLRPSLAFSARRLFTSRVPSAFGSRPRVASRITGLAPSLYARIQAKIAAFKGEVYPFHIGESFLLPAVEVTDSLESNVAASGIHHYGHPQGLLSLREEIALNLNRRHMPEVTAGDVIVTHGATHGLNLICQAILDPGDVMMVLSPHWPLLNSMVHTSSAVALEVPFFCQIRKSPSMSPYAILKQYLHPRTRAVYITSPNNPDGVVLSREELASIAKFCVEHDIYAIVDEAYDRFHFSTRHPAITTFEGMDSRTISVFTFSKSHRMAGLRVGYCVAPPDVRDAMIKLANISVYNVSLLTQMAALSAIRDTEASVQESLEAARDGSKILCNALSAVPGIRFDKPEGGAYVFADLTAILKGRDCFDLLDECVDMGIVFAPGLGFGQAYGNWARFCFTTMEPEKLKRGADKLVEVLKEYQAREPSVPPSDVQPST